MSSDHDLLARWRDGDRDAGSELFERHFASVRRFFANKVDQDEVDDLIQRTFVGCLENVTNYRGDSGFRTYLLGIARYQLLQTFREHRSRDRRVDPDATVDSVAALGRTPTSVLAAKADEAVLIRALQRVSVDHQTMLELHYWEQLPNDEIADICGINRTTVRTRLHRARKALAQVIEAELLATGADATAWDIDATARGIDT